MKLLNQTFLIPEGEQTSASDNFEFQFFLRMAYDHAERLSIDTETNGLELKDGRGHAIGLSVAARISKDSGYAYYFPFRHQTRGNLDRSYLAKLKELIESRPVNYHNAKHDIPSLKSFGINTPNDFHCTMLINHRINENHISYQLDWLSRNLLGLQGKVRDDRLKMAIKLFGWDGVPPEVMAEYAAMDAVLCDELDRYSWPIYESEDESGGELWEIEKKFIYLLNKMEANGIRVNLDLAAEEIERGEKRMRELCDLVGYNLSSRNEMKKLFLEDLKLPEVKTSDKTGQPSFDKQAMEIYDDMLTEMNSPVAKQILEFRGYQKAVSSYWRSYQDLVSPDGRIRPNFNLHRTLTGRLSCDTPNLQQIPRITEKPWNKNVKPGFIPENGNVLYGGDYKQLELRLAAAYGREQSLLEIFADDDRDIFNEMSVELDQNRQDTKTFYYANGYGAGPKKIAAILGATLDEVSLVKARYAESYPGLQNASKLAADVAKGQGFIRLWTGRRRHFKDRYKEAHKAFNSAMQGGAAEIVKRQMIAVDEELGDDTDLRMLLQVHDELMFEFPKGKEDYYGEKITKIMENVKPDFGVTFKVDWHEWGK